ncbi:toll/interleukin-1 receptor domain-containing adapter protein [Trichomycterus rosablanca]|uniref:toll/interleukin-1 receptor domain-containing adapter protein n=1 Tax=Trichomycterus rosablanca TaxID=2290929 RepID=UPI002F3546EC
MTLERGWLFQRFGNQKKQSTSSSQSQVTFSNLLTDIKPSSSSCVSQTDIISTGVSTALSVSSHSSCPSSQNTSSSFSSPSSAQSLPPALSAPFRFTRTYDVCVCHSDKDNTQASALVSFLETSYRGLRCYWYPRDCSYGAALSTELCKAIQASHCWVLLLSPQFMQDEWCWYQMQQVISEGPMSQRIIPTMLNMRISEIPKELRFFYTVDLNRNQEAGYTQVYRTVLQYLKDMCKREELSITSTVDCGQKSEPLGPGNQHENLTSRLVEQLF